MEILDLLMQDCEFTTDMLRHYSENELLHIAKNAKKIYYNIDAILFE